MALSLSSNTDAASDAASAAAAATAVGSNPKDNGVGIGPSSTAKWKAATDAIPQDVLLPSPTIETDAVAITVTDVKVEEEDLNAAISICDTTFASKGTPGSTQVERVFAILGLLPDTNKYLESKYQTMEGFDEFLQLSSEEVWSNRSAKEDGKFRARFYQADRAKLILVGRWTERNLEGHESKWAHFNKKTFNEFIFDEVDDIILDEILKVLHLIEHKGILKDNGAYSPASFVLKSQYWFEHEMKLSSRQISQIEKFKRWYNYQLDDYLPSDWIVSFRKDSEEDGAIEWRKVLKAIGLKADAVQALELNDISDFETLIHASEKWRVNGPKAGESPGSMPSCNEWQESGLKESDARNIISFRQWHKFYVAGQEDKADWAADFNSAHYKRFVQRHIDLNKPDEELGWRKSLWKLGWWASPDDSLTMSREKKDVHNMLERASEDGIVTDEVRYRLRQHFDGRREKMDLLQEINEGTGDTPFLEERLNQIFKVEAEDQKRNEEESLFFVKEYYHFVLSALVAYMILSIWTGLTIYFIVFAIASDDWKRDRVENRDLGDDYQVDIINISFGLVTAVVVKELNEGANDDESSLYNRFLATYKKRLEQSKVIRFENWLRLRSIHHFSSKQRIGLMFALLFRYVRELVYSAYTWLILNSSRVYIVSWIILGASSLIVGIVAGVDATNSLHTIGETWIGIALTIVHSFFGLNSTNSPGLDDERSVNDEHL